MSSRYRIGSLYKAVSDSNAHDSDPWGSPRETINPSNVQSVEEGKIVLLVEYHSMEEAGIFIFLLEDKIVWQVIRHSVFPTIWKKIQ